MTLPRERAVHGADLTGVFHRPIVDDDVVAAERIVWGRVKALLKLEARPASLDDTLAGQVLELGAIAYTNPEALSRYVLEGERASTTPPGGTRSSRRSPAAGVVAPGSAPKPRGSFPAASLLPRPGVRPVVRVGGAR
jgi:hypothetical protein